MGKCINARQDAFAEPTTESLAGLGAGCFVQFKHNGQCDWVEITRSEGDELVGISHPELSESDTGEQSNNASEELRLCKEQITALGCDRYCVC